MIEFDPEKRLSAQQVVHRVKSLFPATIDISAELSKGLDMQRLERNTSESSTEEELKKN